MVAAGTAPANAQASRYTVCKDGTTWMTRGAGICGGRGGVDPKRSTLANRSLNARWPRDIEIRRRREFERRMMQDIYRERRYYESNGEVAKKADKANDKVAKADAKALMKAQKTARKP
jgi:hypothetical protein